MNVKNKGLSCKEAGCDSPAFCKGWCKRHHDRWRRHGNPQTCLKPVSGRGDPLAWLHANVSYQGADCLIWPFARFPDGRAHMAGDKPARVMCELVNGPPPTSEHEAAHSCGKGHEACVSPRHLTWKTPVENSADKIAHGTLVVGEAHHQAKLSEATVREIRALSGTMLQREIAAKFGVTLTCVNKVLTGRAWRHVA